MALHLIKAVEELMDIVVNEEQQDDAWQWLLESVRKLEQRLPPKSLTPSHIAQALLLAKITDRSLPILRKTQSCILTWEDRNKDSCVTLSKDYHQIHLLCIQIAYISDDLDVDWILLQTIYFGLIDRTVLGLLRTTYRNIKEMDILHPKAMHYIYKEKDPELVTFSDVKEDIRNLEAMDGRGEGRRH